jgi:hypothetical protein
VFEAQHGERDAARLRTGEAHHANASASRRGGDGHNGIVQLHEFILIG